MNLYPGRDDMVSGRVDAVSARKEVEPSLVAMVHGLEPSETSLCLLDHNAHGT